MIELFKDEYDVDDIRLSFSSLNAFRKSPLSFVQYKMKTFKSTPAMVFGDAVHTYILENDIFKSRFAVAPNVDRRTKVGKAKFNEFQSTLKGHEIITAKAKQNAIDFLGKENVIDLDLRMTAEDFSYYTQSIPGCFYRLGTANTSSKTTSALHTSTFNIDENALETSTGLMAWLEEKIPSYSLPASRSVPIR